MKKDDYKPTLNDKLIAAIGYKSPENDLIQNIGAMGEVWTVLIKNKEEVIKILNNYVSPTE